MSIFKQNKESTRLHRTILHPIKNYRAFKKQSINYVNARAKYIKQHEKEYDHNSSKQAQKLASFSCHITTNNAGNPLLF